MLRRFGFLTAVLASVLCSGCYSGSRPPHVGSAAKEFTVADADHSVSLNQYRGQVVLVNFWATWCPPCVEELPSLMMLQERMKGRGVVVVGVSIDVDGDAYHRFLKLHNINFVTVRDPEQKVASMYGTSGWPETYIIDRQGVLRRKFVGPVDWNAPDVIAFLSRM
ncbi:MAG TPA: TlpA disulfide reductase family protein [Candidatus Sulfotelmatobacter sp.]